jgi:hypothetical protein
MNRGVSDWDHLIVNLGGAAKVFDRAAALENVKVINDHVTSFGKPEIQIRERIHGGFVHIAIEAHEGEAFDRSSRQRIFEPPFKELHLIVQ